MYLLGTALGAVAAMFLVSRFARWVLRKAGMTGRGAIVVAHAASLALATIAACVAFGDGGSAQVALAAALYGGATAACLGTDLATFKSAWWRRPVYQVI